VIEHDSVVVSAEAVPAPVAVRYAWGMNPSHRNLLYNREGIPASPFRTDDWPLFDAENYVPAEQVKPERPAGYMPVPLKIPPMTQ
jgi:sialate O-acetylesterase